MVNELDTGGIGKPNLAFVKENLTLLFSIIDYSGLWNCRPNRTKGYFGDLAFHFFFKFVVKGGI